MARASSQPRPRSTRIGRDTTFEFIRRTALSLPGVEEVSSYGRSGLRSRGRLFLIFREDLDSIVLRATADQRDAMIAEDPATYYTTDHYRAYPWVLVRVSKLAAGVLPDLLEMALRFAPEKRRSTERQ